MPNPKRLESMRMSIRSRASQSTAGRGIEWGADNPFAAAFRATPLPMVITDPRQDDNPIAFANPAFLELTGYARDDVIGRNCRFLQGPGTDRATAAAIRAAVADGSGIEVEILNYRKDGSEFRNGLVISPVFGERGDLLYFVASQRDVSGKNETTQSVSEKALEAEVARRTADLRTALDRQAELLRELDHRVKNNLQVVSSLLLLKARRVQDDGTRRAFFAMSERINALSAAYRPLQAADDGSLFDLAELIVVLTGDLMAALPEGRIQLALDIEPTSLHSSAASPVALLVNEIVGDAIRHAFPSGGSGRLFVKVRRHERSLRIVIEDDGIGMQGHAADHDGFGRSLIEIMARQLHADVAWEDAGPGTRVVVTIPMAREGA